MEKALGSSSSLVEASVSGGGEGRDEQGGFGWD